jgi:phage gp29-like protein
VAATVLRIPVSPPFATARIDPTERTWTNTRWGDLKASTLSSIIARADRGEVGDWADLCEYAMATDGELASVYRTAIDRVVQSDYVIRAPEESWDPELAEFAATLVRQQVTRIRHLDTSLSKVLHALGPGFSASEMHWRRDERRRINYVERLEFIHPHRFRYDEQKKLRLYDGGRRSTVGSAAGEQLPPTKWIVHEHMEVAGYPGACGIMKGCIWTWMFGRWVEKFRIAHQEKHGSPFIYASVNPNSLEQVRDQILDDLQNLTSEQAAVFEKGVDINQIEAIATSDDGYHQYLADKKATYAMAWHGASDIAVQGDAGSQAAVSTRASVNADPRMVSRGKALSETLRYSLFRALIEFNIHLVHEDPRFAGVAVDDVPLPVMRRKTADDEVQRDQSQREQEIRDDSAAPEREPIESPKAGAPAAPGQTRASRTLTRSRPVVTRQTSSRSPSPFAQTLRRG